MFPFGQQNCSFWVIFKTRGNDHVKVIIEKLNRTESLLALKRTTNGDFKAQKFTNELYEEGKRAGFKVSILFSAQYNYYLLNNYLPSLLIFVIAYSTLYFPINNFNERVMVSLTSLLVLATFFTQASESIAHTPYVKMIDIWFITLIGFNFVIVILNVVTDLVARNDNKVQVAHKKTLFPQLLSVKSMNAEVLNFWEIILLTSAFMVFMLIYGMIAYCSVKYGYWF